MGYLRAMLWTVGLSAGLSSAGAHAQAGRDVDLGNGASARYRIPAGPMSNVAFLIVHRTSDYRDHAAAIELRARSFATLGIRTRFKDSASVVWDRIAIDVRNAVRFLRAHPGITKVGGCPQFTELHAKIGELTGERDFLEQGLRRLPGRSARR